MAKIAKATGTQISDYLLYSPQAKQKFPAGVFITAEYDQKQADSLKYFKLGNGPFYTLVDNYHLCQIEMPNTIREVLRGEGVLINNSLYPTASVGAVAKIKLEPGTFIPQHTRASFVRGEALSIKDMPTHVPMGLIHDVVIKQPVEPGQMLDFSDIDLPETKAYDAWKFTLNLIKTN